ncbi:MAG: 1-phosphofructokinase [Fimbriimonadaceae bacterium]|nr:1-phosphofructokinase [Fimbriimonadaceae bacterium]
MILTVTLNPCVDLILFAEGLKPHDTNRVQRKEEDAGGKGVNVSRVAAELGAETSATGFLGGGPGGYVERVLKDQGVDCRFIPTAEPTRINVSVESGDGPPTTFNMKGPLVQACEWDALLAGVGRSAADADWVCLGGSLPPGVPDDAWAVLGRLAKDRGARVVLDADGPALLHGLTAAPDLVKPNRREAERWLGRDLPDRPSQIEAAREILARLRDLGSADPTVLLSLGGEGALCAAGSDVFFAPPIPIQVKSTIGSGDSMIGGFLAALQAGKSLEDALAQGSAAGAATATTDGTEIARREVVQRLLPSADVVPV